MISSSSNQLFIWPRQSFQPIVNIPRWTSLALLGWGFLCQNSLSCAWRVITDTTCTGNQLCLEILVVCFPFSLNGCLHCSDQRNAITLEAGGTRPFLGAMSFSHGSSSWAASVSSNVAFLWLGNLVINSHLAPVCPHTFRGNWSHKPLRWLLREKSSSDTTGIVSVPASSTPRWRGCGASLPLPTIHAQYKEQRELEPTSATPQLHTWPFRLLNLQLFSPPQQPHQNNLQHHCFHPATPPFCKVFWTWVSCTPCISSSNSTLTRWESSFLRRVVSRPWPPCFRQPSATVKWKPSLSHRIMDSIGRSVHKSPCRSISLYTSPRTHQTLKDKVAWVAELFGHSCTEVTESMENWLIAAKPTTIPSQLSSAFSFVSTSGGHQCRRRTAQTDLASFVSNSFNPVSLFRANNWQRCDPIFCSCYATLWALHSSGFPRPFLCFCLSLSLAPCSCSCPCSWLSHIPSGSARTLQHFRSKVPVLILDKLDMRATRSVVRATTLEYDSRVSIVLSRSPIHQSVSRYHHRTARSTTTLRSGNTDQNNCAATMCKEMNCDDKSNVFVSQTSRTKNSPHKKENSAQHAQNSATHETARKTTLHRSEEGRSTSVSLGTKNNRQILHSAWFSKHTTRLPVHTSACSKHSKFHQHWQNEKRGWSNRCSHETLLHFGLQQLWQGRGQTASEQLKS